MTPYNIKYPCLYIISENQLFVEIRLKRADLNLIVGALPGGVSFK